MSNEIVLAKIDEINKLKPLEVFSHPSSVEVFKKQFGEKANIWLQRERSYLVQIFNDVKLGPELNKCTTFSLHSAITSIITNNLTLDPQSGQAFLVPFKDSVKVMYGYKGKEQMMVDAGIISYIEFCEPVYDCDKFRRNMGKIVEFEQPTVRPKGAKVIGGCIRAKMPGGGFKDLFLSKEEIDKRAKVSKSKGEYGPWKDWYDEMVKKSMIHALYKSLPKRSAALDKIIQQEEEEFQQEPEVTASYEEVPEEPTPMTEPEQTDTFEEAISIVEQIIALKEKYPDETYIETLDALLNYDIPEETLSKYVSNIEKLDPDRIKKMGEYIKANFRLITVEPIEDKVDSTEDNNEPPF